MRTPDQYRELAAECYRLASEAKIAEHQKIMREMAQALREVAEELETKDCSAKMRREGLQRISPSCRSYCAKIKSAEKREPKRIAGALGPCLN
jgi:DNA topoisomerase VI subunit B